MTERQQGDKLKVNATLPGHVADWLYAQDWRNDFEKTQPGSSPDDVPDSQKVQRALLQLMVFRQSDSVERAIARLQAALQEVQDGTGRRRGAHLR